MRRFSSTVISGKMPRPSGTRITPRLAISKAGSDVRSCSLAAIFPDEARCSPTMVLRSVLLPALFAPMSATVSLGRTSRLTSWSTGRGPYPALTRSTLSKVELLSQIRLDHLPVRRHFPGRALGELLPEVQRHDPVAEPHDDLHPVLHHHEGHALFGAEPKDQLSELVRHPFGEPGHELVEQDERRLGREHLSKLEPLVVREAQIAD